METAGKEQKAGYYHHGHAIKRLHRDNRLIQKQLGGLIGLTQEAVDRFGMEEVVDDDIWERFARGLNVTPDFVKR